MTTDWVWMRKDAVLAVHQEQLIEHGGGDGVRDDGMLGRALARPLNLAAYGEPDAADLAAAYAFGIARNHPFVDGNKRTAAVAAITFLWLNDRFTAIDEAELAVIILELAAGGLAEDELAAWFRDQIAER